MENCQGDEVIFLLLGEWLLLGIENLPWSTLLHDQMKDKLTLTKADGKTG